MKRVNLAMAIMGMFVPPVQYKTPSLEGVIHNREPSFKSHKSKGQLRSAKPKASGAAQLKRDAKKRKNKR